MIGKYVVVRTHSAGVLCGELVSREAQEVGLLKARIIWAWDGANTVHEIAACGVGVGSKVSCESPGLVILTQAISILECSKVAEQNLRCAGWS